MRIIPVTGQNSLTHLQFAKHNYEPHCKKKKKPALIMCGHQGLRPALGVETTSKHYHYENIQMQYNTSFHCSMNVLFQLLFCNIFLIFAPTWTVGMH